MRSLILFELHLLFNPENVKVVILVVLLICLNYSHILFSISSSSCNRATYMVELCGHRQSAAQAFLQGHTRTQNMDFKNRHARSLNSGTENTKMDSSNLSKLGQGFSSTHILPFYFFTKYFVDRLMSVMPTSVPYSTTSGQTLFVHIHHKTGNVNNDRHFYNLRKTQF